MIEGPICSDGIEKDPNTLASLDDPVEYPHLVTLNQSKMLGKPVRTLKRPTSISPSQRTSKKKQNSRVSLPDSKEFSEVKFIQPNMKCLTLNIQKRLFKALSPIQMILSQYNIDILSLQEVDIRDGEVPPPVRWL